MELIIIILVIVLFSYAWNIEKRLKKLGQLQGPGYSDQFSVSAYRAILKNKKYGELVGIKSIAEGKDFKDWSKHDKDKWEKEWLPKSNKRLNGVSFSYLSSENAYFIKSVQGDYIKFRDLDELLYSAVVAGDEDFFQPHIDLKVYERRVNGIWMLTVCLEYDAEDFSNKDKNEFITLCEFPLAHLGSAFTDEQIKKLGFEVERRGADTMIEPWYKDPFGETKYYTDHVTYKRNGVEIHY